MVLEISPYLGGDFAQVRLVYVEGEKFLLPWKYVKNIFLKKKVIHQIFYCL